jgi:hypothetical protein
MLCKDLSWIFLNIAESHRFKTTGRLEPKGKSTDPTEEIQVPKFKSIHWFILSRPVLLTFFKCLISYWYSFSAYLFLSCLSNVWFDTGIHSLHTSFYHVFIMFILYGPYLSKFSWIFHHFSFVILNKTISLTMSLKLFLTFLSLMLITSIMRSVSILSRNFL